MDGMDTFMLPFHLKDLHVARPSKNVQANVNNPKNIYYFISFAVCYISGIYDVLFF